MVFFASDTSDTSDKIYNQLVLNKLDSRTHQTNTVFMSEVVRSRFLPLRTGSDRFGRYFGQFFFLSLSLSVFYILSDVVCTLNHVSEILLPKSAFLRFQCLNID